MKLPTPDPEKDWPVEQQRAAQAEGWDIFETGRGPEDATEIVNGRPYGHRPYELQALTDAGKFESDEDAQRHVLTQSMLHSKLHRDALAFLKKFSPAEYEAIKRGGRTRR